MGSGGSQKSGWKMQNAREHKRLAGFNDFVGLWAPGVFLAPGMGDSGKGVSPPACRADGEGLAWLGCWHLSQVSPGLSADRRGQLTPARRVLRCQAITIDREFMIHAIHGDSRVVRANLRNMYEA